MSRFLTDEWKTVLLNNITAHKHLRYTQILYTRGVFVMLPSHLQQKKAHINQTRMTNYYASLRLEGITPPAIAAELFDKKQKATLLAKYRSPSVNTLTNDR